MSKVSLGWRIFIGIETVAVVSWFGWELVTASKLGEAMWVAQLILLMPGNITATPVIEHLLWNSSLSLTAIGLAELVGSLVVNAVLWFLLLSMIRRSSSN
jgi:hypothetical protein